MTNISISKNNLSISKINKAISHYKKAINIIEESNRNEKSKELINLINADIQNLEMAKSKIIAINEQIKKAINE